MNNPNANFHMSFYNSGSGLDQFQSIQLNNAGVEADRAGRHDEAIKLFNEAIAIKTRLHGATSVHVCISLSGLADAYLNKAKKESNQEKRAEALAAARSECERMLRIAMDIGSREQQRIGTEILQDISKLDQKGAPDKKTFKKTLSDERSRLSTAHTGAGSTVVTASVEPPTRRCYNATCPGGFDPANLKQCGRCRRVLYCSRECQQGAWQEHKITCQPRQ